MTPEATKRYLTLCALACAYDIDANGVDAIPAKRMRWVLKKLILHGHTVKCALCGKDITCERDLTLDHIVPRSRGGSDYLHNMQPAHRKCNELKGNDVTDADIEEACANSNDSVQEITERKKKRREAYKRHRNAKWIKPWQIETQNCHR